jgi:hypothetical protein
VVCIGAHDECDRWLEINRDWEPGFSSTRVVARRLERRQDRKKPPAQVDEAADDPLPPIDQKTLRVVFSGLCGDS